MDDHPKGENRDMKNYTNKWRLIAFALLALMLVITACASGDNQQNADHTNQSGNETNLEQQKPNQEGQSNKQVNTPDSSSEAETGTTTQYPLTVLDASGEEWELEAVPQRIVSTSPAETEILFALGLGDRIVAVSDYCTYPAEAAEKDKIGGIVEPNIEAILAADPDLVVTGISLKEELVGQMRGLGLNVYASAPRSLEEIFANIERLGEVTDTQEQAEQVIASMRADMERVTQAVSNIPEEEKKRVYVEFAPGWTVGKGEFLHELIELAGAVNIAGDIQGWAQINEEKIIQDNPEVIIYPEGLVDFETNKPIETLITERGGWGQIAAIEAGNLHGLDENLLTIPGPRITQGLIELAAVIYPDRVN